MAVISSSTQANGRPAARARRARVFQCSPPGSSSSSSEGSGQSTTGSGGRPRRGATHSFASASRGSDRFNGRVPGANFVLQATAKSALVGLTKGLARELGPRGITATLVDPGPIDTDMNPADGETAAFQSGLTVLGRYGRAEDIAAAVAFLAGPGGGYVTGTVLAVDGGYTV